MDIPPSDKQEALWTFASTLWKRRWLVIGVTGLSAIASVVISLLLPNWYLAQTRLLLPTSQYGGFLAGAIPSGSSMSVRSLLSGEPGDYERYMAILDSRTVNERVVHAFDLTTVYGVADSETSVQAALDVLQDNVDFLIDDEYYHFVVQVYDQDPVRAADMANFFVEELNRMNSSLMSLNETTFRERIEQRYKETEAELDSVRTALQDLQAASGVLDLDIQGEAFMSGISQWRSTALLAEVEHARLHYLYGPNNAAVRSARLAMETSNALYEAAMEGNEALLPVARDSLPELARQFQTLQTEALILSTVLQYMRPVVEDAILGEQFKSESVQVVDRAVPPVRKARPWRTAIVVSSTMSGFILVVVFVVLSAWWREHHTEFARRMRLALERGS